MKRQREIGTHAGRTLYVCPSKTSVKQDMHAGFFATIACDPGFNRISQRFRQAR